MPIFLAILAVIGAFLGYEFSLLTQGIIIVVILIIFYLVRADDIGDLFLFIFGGYMFIGLVLGNLIYFINPNLTNNVDFSQLNPNNRKEIKVENIEINKEVTKDEKNKQLELICKSNGSVFYLTSYKIVENDIINLKTDQVFNKYNCEVK